MLVGPAGQKLVLFDDICGNNNGGDAANSVSNVTATLIDTAAGSLPSHTAGCIAGLTNGSSYKPTANNTTPSLSMPSPAPAFTIADDAAPRGTATFASKFTGAASGDWKVYAALACVCGTPTLGDASTPSFTLTVNLNVAAAPTSTAVTSSVSPNPVFSTSSGNTLTYNASVTSSSTVNSGTVTFLDGASAICSNVAVNGSGQAACPITYSATSAERLHFISATYNGVATFSASTSSTISQLVKNHSTNPAGTQFCNPGTLTIPASGSTGGPSGTPASIYPSEVQVSGQPGIIQNVTVQLNGYTSPNSPKDLGFMLVGPNGKAIEVMGQAGGTTAINGVNVTLDDAAANLIPAASSITSGSWKPTVNITGQPESFCTAATCGGVTVAAPAPSVFDLAAPRGTFTLVQEFGGISPNGNWNLFAVERGNPGTASLTSWCVAFTTTSGAATTTTVTSNQNPALTGQPANSVVVTATVSSSSTVNSGTVTFTENGANLASPIAVVNGLATLDVSALAEGTHIIVA
ncbi:MAG: Ig-like domain-containing protein, partial [Bryobacteraceae bacterium]